MLENKKKNSFKISEDLFFYWLQHTGLLSNYETEEEGNIMKQTVELTLKSHYLWVTR